MKPFLSKIVAILSQLFSFKGNKIKADFLALKGVARNMKVDVLVPTNRFYFADDIKHFVETSPFYGSVFTSDGTRYLTNAELTTSSDSGAPNKVPVQLAIGRDAFRTMVNKGHFVVISFEE